MLFETNHFFSFMWWNKNLSTVITYYKPNVKAHAIKKLKIYPKSGTNICASGWKMSKLVLIHSLHKCKQKTKLGKKQKLLLFKRTKLAKINRNYFWENFKFRKKLHAQGRLKIKSTADCQSLLGSRKTTYIFTNFVTKTIYLKSLFPVTTSDNESIYSSSVQA